MRGFASSRSRIEPGGSTRFQTYASTLTDLVDRGYIDESLGSKSKAGDDFFYAGTGEVFVCFANPHTLGTTGDNFYFTDQVGVIHFNPVGVASVSDPPIGSTGDTGDIQPLDQG